MLRTLAINSNQIVLSFGVLIAFLSPKQSEIEESSLESLSKSRIQGVWDPAHSTRVGIPPGGCQKLSTRLSPTTLGCRHFHPEICRRRHSTRLQKAIHPDAAIFHFPSENLLPLSTRMFHIRNSSLPSFHPNISHPALDAGWERRAFQLPQSDVSGSFDSAYPESFAAILHSATVFS